MRKQPDPKRWTRVLLSVLVCLAWTASAVATIPEHQELEGPFATGPEVTAACLDCHDDVAEPFMKTSHWTWSALQEIAGHGEIEMGKINAVNNFCVGLAGNWPRCTSCHAGYGWQDGSFDFSQANNIDCLVCHDTSGQYKKFPTSAGHPAYEDKEWQGKPWPAVDLLTAARSAGKPTRDNCGTCHFFGGGGNAVKHGDLDTSLLEPVASFDVHMGTDGENMSCQECHSADQHSIAGSSVVASPGGYQHIDCTSCHDAEPHGKKTLDRHVKSVACQTCHIPVMAKENPTKIYWDWSTAGEDRPQENDEFGKPTYAKKKGSFVWAKDLVPTYAWYNGRAGAYQLGDKIDPAQVTLLNWPLGGKDDLEAKIYPFKVHGGKQPYDVKNDYLINPKLFGKGGYWKTWDWIAASQQGMELVGLDFSGEVGFAPTELYLRVNHMVVPEDQALKCKACHPKEGVGRMDWNALGYESDPKKDKSQARYGKK